MPRPTAQPGRLRRFFGLKKVLAANLLLFVIIAWGFSGEYLRNRRMEHEIERLQQEADLLSQKNSELAELSQRFRDGGMLEKEARTKLNLRRPGEEVVIIRQPQSAAPAEGPEAAVAADARPVRLSNPQKWWRYFFH